MDTLTTVVSEIVICLVVAWILGFLVAWMLFKRAANSYIEEIDELEENLSYSLACNRNQERELIRQSQQIEELEKLTMNSLKEEKKKKDSSSQQFTTNLSLKRNKKELDMLKGIEDNLYSIH